MHSTAPLRAGVPNDAPPGLFEYRAFGLNFQSDFELVGGLSANGLTPDVRVRLAEVPANLVEATDRGVCYSTAPDQVLINFPNIARILVCSGNDISVQPASGVDPGAVLLLLYSSAFGALLHQRGVLALHGSVIATKRGAVVIAGPSGCGKSTLACEFHRRGFPVLADDICAIRMEAGPVVLAGNPFLMVWADVAARWEITKLQRVRRDLEKYIVPLETGFRLEPSTVHAVYVLNTSNSTCVSLSPLQGLSKLRALLGTSFRPGFIEGMALTRRVTSQIVTLAHSTKAALVRRPRGAFLVDELADVITADFER